MVTTPISRIMTEMTIETISRLMKSLPSPQPPSLFRAVWSVAEAVDGLTSLPGLAFAFLHNYPVARLEALSTM
jgi:hypothetical protein